MPINRSFLLVFALVASAALPPARADEPRPRAREAGVVIGTMAPGPRNAITDVDGVGVGHATLVEGTRLTRTEVDQGGEGDTPILAARLSFEVSYWTKPVIDDGVLPLQVLVSWVPEIGVSHEHSYQPVDTHYREPSA